MSDEFENLIGDTIRYLEQLKQSGVDFINVSRETMEELAKIPPGGRPSPLINNKMQREETRARQSNPSLHHSVTPPPPPPSPQLSEKKAALDAIWERARVCVQCAELAERRQHVVFGVGNPAAKLVFVGEAPGEDEDIQGEPFVGRAGQLLTKIIQAMGLKRSDVYIANILKCRPPNNRKPLPDEMERCLPFLKEQLNVIEPGIIVALGNAAIEGLFGLTGIVKLRGKWLIYKLLSGREVPVMPTFHPSYLLRNPSAKKEVWQDIQVVMEKLGLEDPRRKRQEKHPACH